MSEEGNGSKPEVVLETLTLPNGVKVVLRPPSGSNALLAAELAGATPQLGPTYEGLLCIVSINGSPESRPRTKQMMAGLADRLGRDGLDIVSDWFQERTFPELGIALKEMMETGADAETLNARAAELRLNRLKNSSKTQ